MLLDDHHRADRCDQAIHDRMPAVLGDDKLRPYLEGSLNKFGPSPVALEWLPTENFLTKHNVAVPLRRTDRFKESFSKSSGFDRSRGTSF